MYFIFYKMLDNDNINTMLGETEKYCDIVYMKWQYYLNIEYDNTYIVKP